MLGDQKSDEGPANSPIRNDHPKASDFKPDKSKSDEFKAAESKPNALSRVLHASITQPTGLRDFRSRIEEYVKSQHKDPNHDWVRFYRFRYITASAFVTRAKIYQTACMVGIFGWSTMQYLNGVNTWDELLLVNCVAGFSLLFLVLVGNLARRVIGICYADPKYPDLVRIAHLSFFGRRVDRVVKLNDISALSDTNAEQDPLFFRLVVKLDGKNQTFFLANGKIAEIDDAIYRKVFGSLK